MMEANPILFLADEGNPISFHVICEDKEKKSEIELDIFERGGVYVKNYCNMNSRSVLLVSGDDFNREVYDRPAFKLSYISDCIEKDMLLNLNDYLHCKKDKADFYQIIFYEKDIFKISKIKLPAPKFSSTPKKVVPDSSRTLDCSFKSSDDAPKITLPLPKVVLLDSDGSDKSSGDSHITIESDSTEPQKSRTRKETIEEEKSDPDDFGPPPKVVRPTKAPYTERERVNMLKYIVRTNQLSGLRGNLIWYEMTKSKVCPGRTWQSLKNHFLKVVIKRLDQYPFLTNKEKEAIRTSNELYHHKN